MEDVHVFSVKKGTNKRNMAPRIVPATIAARNHSPRRAPPPAVGPSPRGAQQHTNFLVVDAPPGSARGGGPPAGRRGSKSPRGPSPRGGGPDAGGGGGGGKKKAPKQQRMLAPDRYSTEVAGSDEEKQRTLGFLFII